MTPRSPTAPLSILSAAFAGGLFFLTTPLFALAPTLTPKSLQCDGSFAIGATTNHPTPTVRVEMQSTTPGLKIGQRRLSVLPAPSTAALWRFDGNFSVTVSSCYTGGCTGGDSCKTWSWTYNDTNGSAILRTGQCTYRDTAGVTCANTMALYGLSSNQAPIAIGAACTASTTTLPATTSSAAIAAIGPLPGAASLGLSSTALQLNGSNLFANAANSPSWDLPATYTLAAWINASAVNGRVVSQQSGSGYWGIGVGATGGLRHFDSRDAANGPDQTFGASMVAAGWKLVHVVRRNGEARNWYINGTLVGTAVSVSTDSFLNHPNNSTLEIGRYSGGSDFFNGTIDDVRILNIALTDDDIRLEYTTQMHKYSSDAGISYSTVAGTYSGSPTNGTTGIVTYIPGEAHTPASRWQFTGQSIDGESFTSPAYGVTIDNSPPIAPSISVVATTANDVTWSWGLPPRVCLPPGSASVVYNLVDAVSGANLNPPGNMVHPTFTIGENLPGSPNQIIGRRLRVTDNWGTALGTPTSGYTLANPPTAASVVPSVISTGSALISWGQNGNPAYTRYLLSYSQNATFATGVSTPTTIDSDHTGSSVPLSGLSAGTTYFVRVQAFSGRSADSYGGTGSVFVSTSFTTLPGPPAVSGTALSNVSILWSWTSVTGAQYYKLFDIAGSTLYTGGALSFAQAGLTTNTQYQTRIEAISANGAGSRGNGTAFTLANNPTLPVVNAAYASSITYSWNANLNPAYTFYEVGVTTDPTFTIIVTTLTVNGTTATANDLFPATSYYARVRSINGSQIYGSAFVGFASTFTLSDPAITTINAPPSAYVPPNGSVGQWHFDESTGATAADTSGLGNTAFLTCVAAACVSTPTFIAGPTGLGSAASFTGLAGGLVRVPDHANYAFTDRISVSAWVKPDTAAQPASAGIAVRGDGGVENFALDVSTDNVRRFRFLPKPGFSVSSTNTITAGVWTHLIGVYDSVAGTATLYVNGRAASTLTGVPARTAAAHDISIGNRQAAAAAYDKGFIGSIDSVRVQRRALTAAEALAEYQGSFVSTVTPPSPNDAILIGLAPNAFGAPATLFVSVDPLAHPITITPAVLNAGLSVIPTGHTLVPNSIIEIVPIVSGAAFTQNLGSSATISMPYADANGNNIIDNTNPPLAASAIKVYTLNTTVNRWELLPTYVDPASRRVITLTPHFSVFAMFAPTTVGTALSQVRVYPIPWMPGTGARFDAAGVTFDRLPVSGTILILTLAGERVAELPFDGAAAGAIVWNGQTAGGRRAASGVYFARITATDGGTSLVKFAIER